jgi:protein TonB
MEMVIKKDEEVAEEEEPVKIEEIKEADISNKTQEGDANAEPQIQEPVVIDQPVVEEPKVFTIVEQMPTFPGGEAALFKYLRDNIEYPSMERDNDIQGRVIVGFVVMEDGAISNVEVKKGVSPGLDKEAIRVVRSMPAWKPGKQQGKSVRVAYVLPILFKLQ